MTDLEPNDWTDDDIIEIEAAAERRAGAIRESDRVAANVCTREWPNGLACCRTYQHRGLCVPVPQQVKA
jgi:hypothetical protein